jgi:hypothetical protein
LGDLPTRLGGNPEDGDSDGGLDPRRPSDRGCTSGNQPGGRHHRADNGQGWGDTESFGYDDSRDREDREEHRHRRQDDPPMPVSAAM